MRIMLAVALAAAISMPTLAFGADAGGDKAKTRRICKEITRTGSHLPPRRICKTAAQWEEDAVRAGIGGPPGRKASGDKILPAREPFPTIN
jgi:hypothetical protein